MNYRQGITHCLPHDNRMPCAECARKRAQYVEDSDE